jgi:Flp pilus assembly protein TadG
MRQTQRGQVLIIFALAAMVFVGIVAISVDYGFLIDQHRNLQAFVDESASASALQLPAGPTMSDRTNARRVAFQYLRDDLLNGSSQTISSSSFTCAGSGTVVDFSTNIDNCTLPSPLGNYTLSIDTPASNLSVSVPNQYWTVSVSITGAVTNALAGLLGVGKSQAGASAVALNNHDQNFPDAVYADGCITAGNSLETIAGQVYIDRCTLQPQSSGASAFCVQNAPLSPGNILYGAGAQAPASVLQGQPLGTCLAAAGGQVIAVGTVGTTSQALPVMVPPPLPPASNCFWTTCPAATTGSCGKMFPPNAKPCYSPGSYGTIGPISNNLNPGVYYITGDQQCAVTSSSPSTAQPCAGVLFKDNTINANWPDVQGACWASPNAPSTGSFTSPCLNGFSFDPTTPTDPQCPSVATISPPTFVLTGLASGGYLDNSLGVTGTDYWVAVTALVGNGETSGTEQKVNVNSARSGKGSITVAITAVPGATGYKVYGPSTTSGLGEILSTSPNPAMPLGPATLTTTLQNAQPGSGAVVPSINTSGNTPLPPPTFTLADISASTPLGAGTYYVRVTGVNNYGETLSSVQSIAIAATHGIGVTITTQPGDTGYWIYGPVTTDGNEISYSSAASPTVTQPSPVTSQTSQYLLNAAATGTEKYPQLVNRSGCPSSGFFNIPTRDDEYNGVTFVLRNNAGICLNIDNGNNKPCVASSGVGSYNPVVLLGPYWSTPKTCNNTSGDSVYPLYSFGSGVISAQGSNTKLGMTGTVYAPGMGVQITQNAGFSVFGQMVIGQFNVQTGNLKNPDVYYGGNCLAALKSGVRLIQ